ncbi:hypothetical protein AeMF1_010892 [Aphanomyces euteiches]|nr:hypothetical protein AeMF1_010892 [Aphanomyces euteiches]KAH9184999.1 hypothetical protein AeNC1_013025 [Aphanomyces euteiches]
MQKSVSFMANGLGRSRNAIARYIKSPSTYGVNYKGQKATKLTDYDRRHIFRDASNLGSSSSQIVTDLKLPVTPRWLTQGHKLARLLHANACLENPPDWSSIIWSDEKKFNLDGPDGLRYYWHDLRKAPETSFSRSFGGKSVMIWACFSSHGSSEIAFLEGTQNSNKYIWTLQDYLFPFAHSVYGEDFTFMHDNAAIHTSKDTKEFLAQNNVNIFVHPALSPDLNPIENLWGQLVRAVYANGKQYNDVESLKATISREWAKINISRLQDLVKSMPRRCIEVVKTKGDITKF